MAKEKPDILVVRRAGFLQPHSPLDEEMIRALPLGVPLKVQLVQPRRSSPQNRLYWAFLRLVCDNLDQEIEPSTLHEWFKLRLGVTKEIVMRNGEVVSVAGSTAFDAMEHADFTAYMQQVKNLVMDRLIPGSDGEAFEREARAMIG